MVCWKCPAGIGYRSVQWFHSFLTFSAMRFWNLIQPGEKPNCFSFLSISSGSDFAFDLVPWHHIPHLPLCVILAELIARISVQPICRGGGTSHNMLEYDSMLALVKTANSILILLIKEFYYDRILEWREHGLLLGENQRRIIGELRFLMLNVKTYRFPEAICSRGCIMKMWRCKWWN